MASQINAREFAKFAEVVLALRDAKVTKKMLEELTTEATRLEQETAKYNAAYKKYTEDGEVEYKARMRDAEQAKKRLIEDGQAELKKQADEGASLLKEREKAVSLREEQVSQAMEELESERTRHKDLMKKLDDAQSNQDVERKRLEGLEKRLNDRIAQFKALNIPLGD